MEKKIYFFMKNVKFILERPNKENRESILTLRKKLFEFNHIDKKYWKAENIEPIEKGYYMFIYKDNERIGMHEFYKYDELYKDYSETEAFCGLENREEVLPPFSESGHLRSTAYLNLRITKVYITAGGYAIHQFALKKGIYYIVTGDISESSREITKKIGFGEIIHEHEYCGGITRLSVLDNRKFFQSNYNKIEYIRTHMEDHS